MELREPIERINEQLIEHYSRDISDGRPNYRVVWSDDQLEKRLTTHDDHGNELMFPEVRLLPKYKQYIRHRYVLERLTVVLGETDLLEKVVYEVVWTFQDKTGKYLPPWFEACRHIIENILMNRAASNYFAKYKDTMSKEEYIAGIEKMEKELFGNETEIGDALHYGNAVVVPGSVN
jgi:hypothetical protein